MNATRTALTIPARTGTATLVEVVRRLDGAGIELTDVGLRRPSLDDVFLKLTESPSEPAPSPGPAPR